MTFSSFLWNNNATHVVQELQTVSISEKLQPCTCHAGSHGLVGGVARALK
jgi:hypothetical protein